MMTSKASAEKAKRIIVQDRAEKAGKYETIPGVINHIDYLVFIQRAMASQ